MMGISSETAATAIRAVFAAERIDPADGAAILPDYLAIADWLAAKRAGRSGPLILGICGAQGSGKSTMSLALAAGLSAVIHWLLLRTSIYQAQAAMVWLTGSLGSVSWSDIRWLLAAEVVLLPLLLVLARRLPVLALGDDLAAGLGVRVTGLRVAVGLVVVGLVAAATAVVGPVAFVGFLSGPIARRLVPGRPAVGVAALVGAVVVVAADHLAAYAVPGTAFPVGVVTGLLGAPVLLWMLRSRSSTQEVR